MKSQTSYTVRPSLQKSSVDHVSWTNEKSALPVIEKIDFRLYKNFETNFIQ